ncbi:MAG: BLUF domain-containing protein [Betaproteobacteria bacterium]|nr:BLUF domain-containing protein [Betaproteobacteria bacterium]MDE2056848.1 BLUF domain-containing protein [Betaproteobacteria bacterium]
MIYYIIYLSSAKKLFDTEALINLLKISNKNNSAIGVTGMLLHKDGNFIQFIEGDQQKVQALFNKIKQDNRHHDVFVIDDGWLDERLFADWKMGFRNLDLLDSDNTIKEGYSDFLNHTHDFHDLKNDKRGALMLLKLFKDN